MPKYVIKCQKFTEKQTDANRIEVYSIWAIENMCAYLKQVIIHKIYSLDIFNQLRLLAKKI